ERVSGRSPRSIKSFGTTALGSGGLVSLEYLLLVLREEERLHAALDRLRGDDDLADVGPRRDLVHLIEKHCLDEHAPLAGGGRAAAGLSPSSSCLRGCRRSSQDPRTPLRI